MQLEYATLSSTRSDVAPVLRSVSAYGTLEGLLLSLTLRQVFRNDSSQNLEVVYTFPLAWGAVLTRLDAELGGKRLQGQVLARAEARERYEDAVEQGDAPIMVEKAQNGVFSAMLGSLKPGEEAVIELSYAQLLAFEQGRIRLVVPTTIAPRYGDAVKQGSLAPHQVTTPDLFAEHAFDFAITLLGPVAQARIASPSHAIAQQREGEAVRVTLQGAKAWLDRDFVLLLENLQGQSFAIAGPDERSGEGRVALIASYCPRLPPAVRASLRLKILVDCSGSMAGNSIAQARSALRPLASLLQPQDQVSYSKFGNRCQRVVGAVDATAQNVVALLHAIDATDATMGGTELALALEDSFALRMESEEADVLLITDGEVWDAQHIVDSARRSGHRIYALGVGSAPAESLLRELAETTGGACEFATPNENMADAVQRLLSRIRLAVPVQAQLRLQEPALWSSTLPNRLVPDETIHMFLRLPERPSQAPTLQLRDEAATQPGLCWREDDLVARLVAAREISLTENVATASALAGRYQLVTEHTNLLLVIERAEAAKTNGMPALHQVRPMLAAGWRGVGNTLNELTPLFSRRQQVSSNSPDVFMSIDRGSVGESSVESSRDIVAAFNAAARQGVNFLQGLQSVTALSLGYSLQISIKEAADQVGGLLRAWACYLLWLHERGRPELQLNPVALALVLEQMLGLDPKLRAATHQAFAADS